MFAADMMRKITIVLMLFLIGHITDVNAQTWLWEEGFGGNNDDEGFSIATDPAGYVYVTGKFQSPTITFGNTTFTNTGDIHIFIVKFTPSGNVVWARDIGGIYDDYGKGIAVYKHGNVYIIGTYTSPIITINSTVLTNLGTGDVIMAKYDSAGNFQWARSAGGTNYDYGCCVAVDASGSVYFGGYYTSSSITFGSYVLPGGYQVNIFVAKYDSSGNCLWAEHPMGSGFLVGLATDNFGHLFLGGTIKTFTNFGNSVTLNTGGAEDPFIAKYDTSGIALWARGCSGSGGDWGEAVATDPVGNCYLTGTFQSDPLTVGTHQLNATIGNYDYFLAKYDSSGNAVWAKGAGGTGAECTFGLCTDHCWNVYVTGVFTSPEMTVGNTTLINPGVDNNEMFVAKYDSSGAVMWAKRGGGTNDDYGYGVASDTSNNIYNTGAFASDTVSFGTDTLHSQGNFDIYLGRIGVAIKSDFAGSDTVICLHTAVSFTNYSINGNTFHWNFGDGDTSNLINPIHIYLDTGTYTVTLIAVNNTPCGIISDTMKFINYIIVKPAATTAFMADTTSGCTPLTINFINNSSNAISYLWNFGDGGTSTAINPSHTYNATGSYTVTLIGYTANGCNDTTVFTNYINASNISIASLFTADTLSGCLPVTVQFTNTGINGTSWLWNFGDGNTSTLFSPAHTYNDSGSFEVTLITFNTSPCGVISDTFKMPAHIVVSSPIPIQSLFTADSLIGCNPFAIKFLNNSINATDFYWSFGDGMSDSGSYNPLHIYKDTGIYHITLVSTNPQSKCVLMPDTSHLDITSISCEYLFIPNTFTPNNDGYNDYFNIIAIGY